MKKITSLTTLAILLTAVLCNAAIFNVNSFSDAVDSSIGNGVCATASGLCTLRAAVQESNFANDADTILLPEGTYFLTRSGADEDMAATGDLDVINPVTINSMGSSFINGNDSDRVFEIHRGPASFVGLYVSNGIVDGAGGCIRNADILDFESGEITNCQATGVAGFGGGISTTSDSDTGMEFVTIANNTAAIAGGGVDLNGIASIYKVTFTGNNAANSGAIRVSGTGNLQMYRSSLNDNLSAALINIGTSNIETSTFYNNTSTTSAGAIANLGILNMQNCTISGNSTTQSGGAISNGDGGTATLNNVTIAHNVAEAGGGIWGSGTVNLENTILASNTIGSSSQPSDCGGTVNSNGHNLIGSLNDCNVAGDETGNVYGQDPLLDPLASRLDSAPIHLLLTGSPAVDAGNDATCEAVDQRAVARPQFASCDIGAVEARVEFTYACQPQTINTDSGGTATSTCTVTSFHGYNSAVTQNCFGLPAGSSCSFNPNQVTPPADGTATSTLSIDTGNTPEGTYSFNVVAVGALNFDSQTLTLVISDAIFFDDFEDNDVSNWTFNKGTWNATQGELTGTVSKKGDARTPDFGGCSDCSIEADLKMGANARASILGWYMDNKNLVEVRLMEDKNKVLLKQRSNGETVAKGKARITIDPDTIYNLHVYFDGYDFHVTLDGVLLFSVSAGDGPQGNAGFRIKSVTGDPVDASFEQIRIE